MATLAPISIVQAGLAPALAAASAGGDQFVNPSDGRTFLVVRNASGGAIVVTIVRQRTAGKVQGEGDVTLGNLTVSVPATTGERWIGPLGDTFNDGNGNVQVTYASVTSLTVAAVRLPALGA
jgi:hypothetical protein